MNIRIKQLLLIVILSVAVMACGLTDLVNQAREAIGSGDELKATAEALATEVAAGVEAAQEAAQTEDSAAVEEVPAEPAEEAAQQDSESMPAADEPAADSDGEAMSLPIDSIQGSLANISSYQAEYVIQTESAGQMAQTTMLIEETKEPRAVHIVLQSEGDASSQAAPDQMDMYVLTQDGSSTMYMQSPEDQSWFSMTTEDINEAEGMLPFALDTLDSLPAQSRFMGQKEINGVLTNHYNFNKDDFAPGTVEAEELQGDVWIAVDKNIVMKLAQKITTTAPLFPTSPPDQLSTYTINFEIKKLDDSSIVIKPPEEALASESFELPGASTDTADIEWPMVDDATVEFSMTGMVSYTTNKSVQEVWSFYQAELGSNWDVLLDSPESVMAALQNDERGLQLIITAADGATSVILSSQ